MRVLMTLVILVTLLSSPVQGQQSNQSFQINDPMSTEAQVPVELLYFNETQSNRPAQVAPPTAVRVPHLDHHAQMPGRTIPMLDQSQSPRQIPTQVQKQVSFAKATTKPAKPRFVGPSSFTKKTANRSIVQTYEGVEVKNHFFFGVDREKCCDEWEGLCGCGGLKSNQGHWGQPWIHGCDACEERGCSGKHSHRRKRQKCRDDSCGSACGN